MITILTTLLGFTSVASIATHYRLDSLEMESWWGRDLLHLLIQALGST